MLVVTRGPFNRLTGAPVVLPITTVGNFARMEGFSVSLMGAGTETTGVVRCDQPRALDLKERKAKKIGRVPDAIIEEVLARLGALLE